MSYRSLLVNTCTTRRKHPGVIDAYGTPAPGWADELIGIACRWCPPSLVGVQSNREIKIGAEVVIVDLELFVEDVDIAVQDRVIIGTSTYEILAVIPRQDSVSGHHKECLLRIVK